jgi:hypothetical protein
LSITNKEKAKEAITKELLDTNWISFGSTAMEVAVQVLLTSPEK